MSRRPAVELVLDLLTIERLGPAEHEFGKDRRGGRQALEALGIAVSQREAQENVLTPRLLRQEGDLQAFGEGLR